MKILVVDDEPSVREILTVVLRQHRHEVEGAANGVLALEAFHTFSPDLVITDRMMPEMDGERLAESIRATDQQVPIVLVSGRCDGVKFPFDAVLPKPFTPNTLIAAIEKAVQQRASRLLHPVAA